MEKRMKETRVLMVVAVGLMLIQCGCGSSGVSKTGFLTNYSRLRKHSNTSLRYVNQTALNRYSMFIVDRVGVHFHHGAKSKGKLTQKEINDLTNYMHARVVKAVEDSGNRVVYQPAAGVGRLRTAFTDIQKSDAVSLVPQARLAGIGLGGVSVEVEIVDSMTGEQIGAVVETQKGSRIPFAQLGKWDAAKGVMNDWAKRIQKLLESTR
jgi:hypothetical protein